MKCKHEVDSFHQHIQKYYEQKGHPRENLADSEDVITVAAAVSPKSIHCIPDQKGTMHQHFYVKIKKILAGDKNLVDNNTVFVAVHYGDADGIATPIPDLKPGRPVIIRGKFIPAAQAYKTDDNPGYPVLHFTHHPVGWVIYDGIKYE